LEYILALGNYLNNKNKKGGAYGIRLSSLDKLKGMKSTDGKSNLLEFLVLQLQTFQPHARDFIDDFGVLAEAARVDITFLEGQVSKTLGMVRRIGNAVKNAKDDSTDRFGPVMTEFHKEAKESMDALDTDMKASVKGITDLVVLYGEDPKKMATGEFLQLFLDFSGSFKKMEEMIQKKKELEERQKARETGKQAKKSPKTPPSMMQRDSSGKLKLPKKKKDKNKIGFALGSLRNDDATKIRAALRRRQKFGTIKFAKSKKGTRDKFEKDLMKKIMANHKKKKEAAGN